MQCKYGTYAISKIQYIKKFWHLLYICKVVLKKFLIKVILRPYNTTTVAVG